MTPELKKEIEIGKTQLTTQEILVRRLLTAMPASQVATRLGMSRENVYKIIERSNKKLDSQKQT